MKSGREKICLCPAARRDKSKRKSWDAVVEPKSQNDDATSPVDPPAQTRKQMCASISDTIVVTHPAATRAHPKPPRLTRSMDDSSDDRLEVVPVVSIVFFATLILEETIVEHIFEFIGVGTSSYRYNCRYKLAVSTSLQSILETKAKRRLLEKQTLLWSFSTRRQTNGPRIQEQGHTYPT